MALATKRMIWIPNDPTRPSAAVGGQWYEVDLSEFYDITDATLGDLLRKLPSYNHTLRWYLDVSRIMLNVIEGQKLDEKARTSGENKTHVKKYVLPSDHEWAYWQQQVNFLEIAVDTLKMQFECLRTYSANSRAEAQAPYHPTV